MLANVKDLCLSSPQVLTVSSLEAEWLSLLGRVRFTIKLGVRFNERTLESKTKATSKKQ